MPQLYIIDARQGIVELDQRGFEMVTFCKDDKLGMENYGAVILWNGLNLLIPSTIAELVEFTSFWIEVQMVFRKLVTKSDIYRFSSELMKYNVWGAVYLLNSSNND